MIVLRVDIYESKPYPIVRHEFRGLTKEECMRYYRAHIESDSFLKDCVQKKHWNSVNCHSELQWFYE